MPSPDTQSNFWSNFEGQASRVFDSVASKVSTVPVPTIPSAPVAPPSKAMEFKVGEGLTPEQTKTADQVIGNGDYALKDAQTNSFWGGFKNTLKGIFEPTPTDIRLPFQTEPTTIKAPPILTKPAEFGYALLEAVPKATAILGGEFSAGFAPKEVKANIDLRRLGFESPNYVTASKEFTDAINNGANPWVAGLGIVSNKTLDVAFGAQLVSDLAKLSTSVLLRGGPEARIEAQNIVDAYKINQKEAFARLKDAPLEIREKTMADLANKKNEAEQVLRKEGSPTSLDRSRVSASRYTELLSRNTPITDSFWSDFAKPDLSLKTPTPTGPVLDVPQLPGTRERPGQAPAFGLSTKEVEGVGKDLQPLAEEARKYKSPEEFKANLTPKLYREFLNTTQAEEVSGKGVKGNLKPTSRAYGDYLYAQDREMFDAQLSDIKKNINLHEHQDLTDFYNKAVGKNSAAAVETALEKAKNFQPGDSFGPRARDIPQPPAEPAPRSTNKLENTRNELKTLEQKIGSSDGPVDFKGHSLKDLKEKQVILEMMKESIDTSPLKALEKFEAKSGPFKGELPEVLGKSDLKDSKFYSKYKDPNVLDFIKRGDYHASEAGFSDTEEARVEYQRYKEMQDQYKSTLRNFADDVKNYKDYVRQDEKSMLEMGKRQPMTLQDLEPPIVRGETQAPKLDFARWKDKNIFFLSRDTFERNLDKVAPAADASALKKFIVQPVRDNELARIKFTNKLKEGLKKKLVDLDIKRNTSEDELIQKYGEKQISLDELKKASPKNWENIDKAANTFRDIYDNLLDRWNAERQKFGFGLIPKVPNYFRHFDEINFFVKNYGFLRSQDELPSEIAGKTEFFKPGKPFTTAELSRTGNSTKYSAIGGFNNYIDSVSKQIFHIDSVQRGRALEKYMENSAKLARRNGEPLFLSNTIANFREYVSNGLAGKTATLDRAIEGTIGRPALRAFQSLSRLIGKNIIVGNLSTALSHLVSLPLIAATTEKVPLTKAIMTTLTSPLQKDNFTSIDGQESSFLTRRYPTEEIMPTMPKKIEDALSYIFAVTDKFKSRLAVAGKYYEGLRSGLPPDLAMKNADIYAGKVLGDYSVGQKPNLMNTKVTSLIAQFQLGLNDSMSVLLHDIPNEGTRWKVASKLIQFAIFSYLFNLQLKKIRGAGKGIDPIELGMTLLGLNDEGAGQSFPKRLSLAGHDLAGELPFSSAVSGNFPLATAISEPVKDLIAGKYAKAAEGVLANVGSPFGGGLQARKTIQGALAIKEGGVFGPSGALEFKQDQSTLEKIKSLVFGRYATTAAQEYFNRSGIAAKKEAPLKEIFDRVQKLVNEGKDDEAQKIIDGLSDDEYDTFKTIRTNAKRADTIQAEREMYKTAVKVQNLVNDGKDQEAQSILEDMTDEEYRIYQLAAKKIK